MHAMTRLYRVRFALVLAIVLNLAAVESVASESGSMGVAGVYWGDGRTCKGLSDNEKKHFETESYNTAYSKAQKKCGSDQVDVASSSKHWSCTYEEYLQAWGELVATFIRYTCVSSADVKAPLWARSYLASP
ncbi:MAG: hypothetical protein EOP06_15000 [Proteobacteria bacterium]|nr:MAG: hypothetical protein EOP06_15000 [Pseudomonadota bacterium]